MTFGTSGTAQSGGLPPVEDADINPVESTDTSPVSKTEKQQDSSQPKQAAQTKDDAPAPDQAKEKGPGPWDAKLQELGLTDPKFSEFLRSEVQPYVTQLEQGGQGGADPQMQEAADSWASLQEAFSEDPEAAYRELGELLGIGQDDYDGGDPMGTDLGDPDGDMDDLALPGEGGDPDDPRLRYVDEMMQRERQEKEDAEFDSFLTQMGERMPGFDPDLFTTFVVAAGGNLDRAMTQYEKYHKAPDPVDAPPPSPDGGSPPPATPRYGSIGDSVSAWLSEEKAATGNRR